MENVDKKILKKLIQLYLTKSQQLKLAILSRIFFHVEKKLMRLEAAIK